jgi:hypothetical protein
LNTSLLQVAEAVAIHKAAVVAVVLGDTELRPLLP